MFALACVLAGLAFQGTRGLWEPDEGRYAEATREMLEAGQWMSPMLEGRPHLTKPPGAYWGTGIGLGLLGAGEWGARLVLGLAFGAAAWCVRRAGEAILGGPAGARAGWCYLAMLYPFAAGSVLSIDTFLAAGLFVAYAGAAAALVAAKPARALFVSGLGLGFAIFTKGHVALLPWGAFAIGFAAAGRRAFPGRRILSLPGVVVALLPVTAWLLWLHLKVDGGIERVLREARLHMDEGDHGEKAWWFYPAILVAGSAPWWGHVVGGIRRLRTGPVGVWLTVWATVTLAVLLVNPTKMALYALPLAVPIALWAGAREPRDPQSPLPWPRAALGAWLVVLCAARGALAFHETDRDMRGVARAVDAADPARALRVGTLAGADLQGLQFYVGGRAKRLCTEEVRNSRAAGTLEDEVAAQDLAGTPWILVADDDRAEARALRRVLGDRPREVARFTRWRVLRIEPQGK